MEINKINTAAVNSYNKALKYVKPAAVTAGDNAPRGREGTFDTLEINFAQSMARAKAETAARLSAELSVDNGARIQSLQSAYAGGDVPVSSEEITAAILGVF
jgi:hypothetical protein